PSVVPLRELAYLPKGELDPHGVADTRPRAGQLPEQVLEHLPKTPAASQAASNQGGAEA
ncbi:MAG: NAD(P)H-quinone oxidoreductase subunit I, partial [Cyanobacteria bacterium K_DeepCast_35m_m2_023]|nr:NAD(P)H-quinone oxidoreductase subunit I [Cyanobacteria bacterium K_DeepCast_35m_m2_023]